MSRVFFASELEGTALYWRIERRDGVALGFTGHDRDLWFDGLLHRAAPGMLPSAIRRNAGLEADSAEVEGALSHDAISAADLAAGRFDGARIIVGVVDWETLERALLYSGELGTIAQEAAGFSADLQSAKAALNIDPVPRTSPTCRAVFCGPGCTLSSARFTHEGVLAAIDPETNRVAFTGAPAPEALAGGSLRWIDGPQVGLAMEVIEAGVDGLLLDLAIDPATPIGSRALLREGCDHTLATCAARFGNAANFQGEPFLPGMDLLARYPLAPQ
ncbi:hypothetical protein SZ64_13020 [Erythrobacter sp. SG61-1L]|uniref:DUF2163 domain-containing protein n=1 Tax=Erythrobacter sp. SG61-1L TaxID=1603897 RepID=UPI0006C8F1AE|nr:DUF2163 domain-containing protein [Erythrobacter sp. SG61-1L]KPL68940.1 hypothetical protein SZ64_13020 [Erythrobacter sp. SG61-1L]